MAISFDFENNAPDSKESKGRGLLSMMEQLKRSMPFVEVETGLYRLAVIWPDADGEARFYLDHYPLDQLIEQQLTMEYRMGVPCWIQRKVVHVFNTFSTECWV